MNGGPIGIAILGCAHIHVPHYLGAIAARSDVALIAVADDDPALAESTADRAGSTVRSVDAILLDPAIDAVLVCSRTARRRPLFEAVAAARKPLFVEKPLAVNGSDARMLASLISASPALFHVGYFMRELEAYRVARDLVLSGRLGTVTRARISILHNGSNERWFVGDYGWMLEESEAGFGHFGDLGVHAVDLLLWIFGIGVEAVTASVGRVPGAQGALDHFGEGTLRYASGVLATIAASGVNASSPLTIELHGTAGVVLVEGGRLLTYGLTVEQAPAVRGPTPKDGLDLFLDAVKGDPRAIKRLIDPVTAAQSVVLVDAMYRAARSSQWITVSL